MRSRAAQIALFIAMLLAALWALHGRYYLVRDANDSETSRHPPRGLALPWGRVVRSLDWRAEEAPQMLTLSGRVVKSDGAAAPGAFVRLAGPSMKTVRASADGRFAVLDLFPGTYELRATLPDSLATFAVRVVRNTSVNVILRSASKAIVKVVESATGAPVVDAEVIVGMDVFPTDQRGEAVVTPVPSGPLILTVRARGRATAHVETDMNEGNAREVEVRLTTAFAVTGHVRTRDSAGVPGVNVLAIDSAFDEATAYRAVTNEDGAFVFSDLPRGPRWFVVEDSRHAPGRPSLYMIDENLDSVVVWADAGAVLTGIVRDQHGLPVAKADITLEADRAHSMSHARVSTSDEAGAFRVEGLEAGGYIVLAELADLASEPTVVQVSKDHPNRMDLTLSEGKGISGVVSDENGSRQPDTVVTAVSNDMPQTVKSSAEAGPDGHFSIQDLPPGSYSLWAGDAAYPGAEVTAHTGDRDVRLHLPRAGGVRGRIAVSGTAGRFRVEVHGQTTGFFASARPDSSGGFELKGLPPDHYRLIVLTLFIVCAAVDFTVDAGKVAAVGTISWSVGGSISGKVLDAADRPVAGARLLVATGGLQEAPDDEPSYRTDSAGMFSLDNLPSPDKPYTLQALTDDCISEPVVVLSGSQPDLVLRLRESGSLMGTVTNAGAPVEGALVIIGDPEVATAQTDADGRFAVGGVPATSTPLTVRSLSSQKFVFNGNVHIVAHAANSIVVDVATRVLTVVR